MTTEYKLIPLEDLEHNTGQIDGVPKNPRQWTQDDLGKLLKSIRETPELLQARGLIVVPNGDKMVVVGGNMRLSALIKLRYKQAPCIVLNGLSTEKICEIVIKDNGSFGRWDWDYLANEWDEELLVEADVISINTEQSEANDVNTVGEVNINDDETMTLKIKVATSDFDAINDALNKLDNNKENALLKALGLV